MIAEAQTLTKSQAACLIALRHHKRTQPEIAIEARLELKLLPYVRLLVWGLRNRIKQRNGMLLSAERLVTSGPLRIERGATTAYPAPQVGGCSNC
jgi:hypothetical protein